ncbi:MAG TPA: hypothetical protein VKN74_02450 [Candidatus Mcinerneyibacterium sp.]|nr:hypothetical protein [Candidatus Mcinerneyibacterium sp.]
MKKLMVGILGLILLLSINSCKSCKKLAEKKDKIMEVVEEVQKEAEKQGKKLKEESSEIASKVNEKMAKDGKPEKFPSDAVKAVEDSFAEGSSELSMDKIDSLIAVQKEINDLDPNNEEEFKDILKKHNFSGPEEYKKTYIKTLTGITAIQALNGMQKIMDSSSEEKKAAETFKMDEATKSLAVKTIENGNLTKDDLNFIYKNWEKIIIIDKN